MVWPNGPDYTTEGPEYTIKSDPFQCLLECLVASRFDDGYALCYHREIISASVFVVLRLFFVVCGQV